MKIDFICVNYNNTHFTELFIKSIINLKGYERDKNNIIIVDNNSDLYEKEELRKLQLQYNQINVIYSEENRGYFGGLNLGLEIINGIDGQVIISNNDIEFEYLFLEKLENKKIMNDIFVISPRVITKDGYDQNPHVITKVSKMERLKARTYFSNYYIMLFLQKILGNHNNKNLNKINENKKNNQQEMVIKRGIGACYVLTKNYFKYFNKLDESIFLWGEEVLLSNQIESKNGKTLYFPSLITYHFESASVKKISSKKRYKMVKKSYKIYRKHL